MARTITASVGMGGVNRPTDTTTIQDLMNRVPITSGGPSPLLAIDGLCGPKTKSAIQNFQLKQFGWKLADGRVDPGGVTLAKLNEYDAPGVKPPPPKQLPKSSEFIIMRMGSETIVSGQDKDLFFYVVDMTNNLGAVYWLQPSGRRKTSLKPPAGKTFAGSGGRFHLNLARSIEALQCTAAWASREQNRRRESALILGFPDSPSRIPMNHHLVGPGGMVSGGDASTSLAGELIFIEYR